MVDSEVTSPTELFMDTKVAPETDHDKVADEPEVMDEGETEKEEMTGGLETGGV